MICTKHDWFVGACPKCAAEEAAADPRADLVNEQPTPVGEPVTATVTEPYIEPPLPEPTDDQLAIPAFLLRRQGGGFAYPSLHSPAVPVGPTHVCGATSNDTPERVPVRSPGAGWTPGEGLPPNFDSLTLDEKQPYYRAFHAHEEHTKKKLAAEKKKELKGVREKQEWEK